MHFYLLRCVCLYLLINETLGWLCGLVFDIGYSQIWKILPNALKELNKESVAIHSFFIYKQISLCQCQQDP